MLVSNIQCTFNLPARCQIPKKKILKEFMNFLPIGPLLHTLIHQNLISWIHKFNNFGLNDQNHVNCTTVLLIYRIEKREKKFSSSPSGWVCKCIYYLLSLHRCFINKIFDQSNCREETENVNYNTRRTIANNNMNNE